jgi:serine/threonine-protein kinase
MIAQRLAAGQIIRDTYTIVKHLGSGAFGDVYLARHRYMGLQAMKIFVRNDAADALEEAYLLTKLSHPNIVRMFEANEFVHEGQRFGYFSMEHVDGGCLLDAMHGGLTFEQRIDLGDDILSGLAFAHAQFPPIIHRDISPSNVLVEKSRDRFSAKVSDFGLAKHVDSESMMASAAGKYLYMAPENFLGVHSTATDVYAAAMVLFELLAGCHPFKVSLASSATSVEVAAVVRQSRTQSIPDVREACASLDERWNDLFRVSLAHDYDERPANANALLMLYRSLTLREMPSVEHHVGENVSEMVSCAQRLAQQAETLDDAIGMLQKACNCSRSMKDRYSELLSLWKRGIVQ